MSVQAPQPHSCINEFFALQQSLHPQQRQTSVASSYEAVQQQPSLHERISYINQHITKNTSADYTEVEISAKDVESLNEELRASKAMCKKAWSELSGAEKFGHGFLVAISFGIYKGYVPKIKVGQFLNSVTQFHKEVRQEKLEKKLSAPMMQESAVGLKNTDVGFRTWKNPGVQDYPYTVTIADGKKCTHYQCSFKQLSEGKVILRDTSNPNNIKELHSDRLKLFVDRNLRQEGVLDASGKEVTQLVEQLVETKLNIKPYGKMHLDSVMTEFLVKDTKEVLPRLVKCAASGNQSILAVTKEGNEFKIFVRELGQQGKLRETAVSADMNGTVTWGERKFPDAQAFKAALSEAGLRLEVAESQLTRTDTAKKAIKATKDSLTQAARAIGVYGSDKDTTGVLNEIRQNLTQLKPEQAGGCIMPTTADNELSVLCGYQGKAQQLPLIIKDNGKIAFLGKEYSEGTPIEVILKDAPIIKMSEAQTAYKSVTDGLQEICSDLKSNPGFYGYYSAFDLFDGYVKFFPDNANIKGLWAINPGPAPKPVVDSSNEGWWGYIVNTPKRLVQAAAGKLGGLLQQGYNYVVPEIVNKAMIGNFNEFTLSVYDGSALKHCEVTIDTNNKQKPYVYNDGKEKKNYGSPEEILKLYAPGLELQSYKAVKDKKTSCTSLENKISKDAGFAEQARVDRWINDLGHTFLEGDYAIVPSETAGVYQLQFYQGKDPDCKLKIVQFSTRKEPGMLTMLGQKGLQEGEQVNDADTRTFPSAQMYFAAIALAPPSGQYRSIRALGEAHDAVNTGQVGQLQSTLPVQPPFTAVASTTMQRLQETEISSRIDYQSNGHLMKLPMADKANKYCFTWDGDDGAQLRLYDNQGQSTNLVITRQDGKFAVESDSRQYNSLTEIAAAKRGNCQPILSQKAVPVAQAPQVKTQVAAASVFQQRGEQAPPVSVQEKPQSGMPPTTVKTSVSTVQPVVKSTSVSPSAKLVTTLSDGVRQDLEYTVKSAEQQLGRRLLAGYMWNKKVDNLDQATCKELEQMILGDSTFDEAHNFLNTKSAKQLGVGSSMIGSWGGLLNKTEWNFDVKSAKNVAAKALKGFLEELHQKAQG